MSLFLYRTFGQMAKVGLKVHQAADGFGVDFGVEISLEIVSIIELWRFPSGCATHLSEVGATRRMAPRAD